MEFLEILDAYLPALWWLGMIIALTEAALDARRGKVQIVSGVVGAVLAACLSWVTTPWSMAGVVVRCVGTVASIVVFFLVLRRFGSRPITQRRPLSGTQHWRRDLVSEIVPQVALLVGLVALSWLSGALSAS